MLGGPIHRVHFDVQVLFIHRPYGSRRVLNQEQVLRLCNAWKPMTGDFKRARCQIIEFKDGAFVENLAMLQAAHILVRAQRLLFPAQSCPDIGWQCPAGISVLQAFQHFASIVFICNI